MATDIERMRTALRIASGQEVISDSIDARLNDARNAAYKIEQDLPELLDELEELRGRKADVQKARDDANVRTGQLNAARRRGDAAMAQLGVVVALCRSFDPTSGSGRAQAFVNDLLHAALGSASASAAPAAPDPAPNQVRPSDVLIVGACITPELVETVRNVEVALVAAVLAGGAR